mmetsp:Transcript_753/g.2988  ORF Transcript_753/g.2988 Transcript_753/m.2988 type:complete len:220 (-) Transcript_753:904-1563(-)
MWKPPPLRSILAAQRVVPFGRHHRGDGVDAVCIGGSCRSLPRRMHPAGRRPPHAALRPRARSNSRRAAAAAAVVAEDGGAEAEAGDHRCRRRQRRYPPPRRGRDGPPGRRARLAARRLRLPRPTQGAPTPAEAPRGSRGDCRHPARTSRSQRTPSSSQGTTPRRARRSRQPRRRRRRGQRLLMMMRRCWSLARRATWTTLPKKTTGPRRGRRPSGRGAP